ncbi:putative NADH-ubiquinone oxidoreductase 9.5 kDa subunit [Triangularia verruculosa]|uniref:NADH-ubiquinone oxidoreductase 9.5 kDa subunit n=1 Tax=Triangularia verruculosa TaxID=2587418 RepID=A0AAN6XHD0_9PEZI|nr:putative NADH-ubiquinone oxidoreductase 9.5 kDa subunit [Triangularia verruculosa]
MSGATPRFWATPLKYCRWAARERPALFWSCVIAGFGPLHLIVVPPVRRALGDYDAPQIPMTYPVPTTPRKKLTGYGDETE